MSPFRLAPAKINLFLHVGAPAADGYHSLVSLMTFADIGDRVSAEPALAQTLALRGPFAAGLPHCDDNLVMRAARAALAAAGRPDAGFTLTLDKQLPVSSGLGGGSSDAGAALHLIDAALDLALGDERLGAIAAGLGADGAACFAARPVLAQGRGERLSAAPMMPDLPCVLVNPGAPSSTAAVFAAYDARGALADAQTPALGHMASADDVAAAMALLRNDLQAPAIALEPRIGACLAALRAAPGVLWARMSGSGSTCFGLCRDRQTADRVADGLAGRPGWWVRACTLAGGG